MTGPELLAVANNLPCVMAGMGFPRVIIDAVKGALGLIVPFIRDE